MNDCRSDWSELPERINNVRVGRSACELIACEPVADLDSIKRTGDFLTRNIWECPGIAAIEFVRQLEHFGGTQLQGLLTDIDSICRSFEVCGFDHVSIHGAATSAQAAAPPSPATGCLHVDLLPHKPAARFLRLVRTYFGDGPEYLSDEAVDRAALAEYVTMTTANEPYRVITDEAKSVNRRIVRAGHQINRCSGNSALVFRGGMDGLVHRSPFANVARFIVVFSTRILP